MSKSFLKKSMAKSSAQLNVQERQRTDAKKREAEETARLEAKIAEAIQIPVYAAAVRQYEYLGKFTREEMYEKIRSSNGEECLQKVVKLVDELGPYGENDMTMAICSMLAMRKAGGWQ